MLPLEVSVDETKALLDAGQILLIDCREPKEAEICRIEGAALIPMSEFGDRMSELAGKEGVRIVVHCHKGGRSYRVADWLRGQGFEQAQSMAGGVEAWADVVEPGMAKY
jgi:rhodanese-related sulfurtransferase